MAYLPTLATARCARRSAHRFARAQKKDQEESAQRKRPEVIDGVLRQVEERFFKTVNQAAPTVSLAAEIYHDSGGWPRRRTVGCGSRACCDSSDATGEEKEKQELDTAADVKPAGATVVSGDFVANVLSKVNPASAADIAAAKRDVAGAQDKL
jgi:hypothetical protein